MNQIYPLFVDDKLPQKKTIKNIIEFSKSLEPVKSKNNKKRFLIHLN